MIEPYFISHLDFLLTRLRIEVHQLREKKTERLQQFSQLSAEEKSLSDMTGSFSLSDGIIFERVPSEDQILQVKNHIAVLKVRYFELRSINCDPKYNNRNLISLLYFRNCNINVKLSFKSLEIKLWSYLKGEFLHHSAV